MKKFLFFLLAFNIANVFAMDLRPLVQDPRPNGLKPTVPQITMLVWLKPHFRT